MDDYLDGRARFAAGCAVLALVVLLVSTPWGIFFGVLGAIFAGASLLSVDEPPTPRTRRVALVSVAISVAAVAISLAIALTGPASR
jgi:phosphatidylserine synthase